MKTNAMKALVLYDSAYGNTENIALAIAHSIAPLYQVDTVRLGEVSTTDIITSDLIIVGSPTQGGRPTIGLQQYLAHLPANILSGIQVAAFDTRLAINDHGYWLRKLMTVIGFAATPLAKLLKSKRGELIAPPEGFIVKNKEGPLKQGEVERAERWAKSLTQHIRSLKIPVSGT